MITTNYKNSVILWQDDDEEGVTGEPALLIEGYNDAVQIIQKDNQITLNYHSIKELIKALKKVEENAGK